MLAGCDGGWPVGSVARWAAAAAAAATGIASIRLKLWVASADHELLRDSVVSAAVANTR